MANEASVIRRQIGVPFQPASNEAGDALMRGTASIGDAIGEFAQKLNRAESEQQLGDARLSATRQLNDLQMKFRTDADPATAAQRYAEQARQIGDQITEGIRQPEARSRFGFDFQQMAEARRVSVADHAFGQQVDNFNATLLDTIETNSRTAALADNPAERASALDGIEKMLRGGVESGFLTPDRATKQMQVARERLALYDGRSALEADPAALRKNLQNRDYLPDLDPLSRVQLDEQASAELKRRAREARAAQAENRIYAAQAISDLREAGTSGLPVAPELVDSARNALAAAGNDPRQVAHYQAVMSGVAVAGSLRGANPQEVSAALQDLAGKANSAGVTAAEAERYRAGTAFLNRMHAALTNDPLAWGNAQGVAKINDLNLTGADTPQAWKDRVTAAETIARRYNIAPVFLTAAEEDQLRTQLSHGDARQKLATLHVLAAGLGSRAPGVLARVAPNDPALSTAAGLLLQGGAHTDAARDILTGSTLLSEKNGGGDLRPTAAVKVRSTKDAGRGWFGGFRDADVSAPALRQAYALAPQEGARTLQAADAIYAARVAKSGLNPKDDPEAANDLYSRALQEAAGAHYDNGRQIGGVTTFKGVPLVLPPNVAADHFDDLAHNLNAADLKAASVTGAAPNLQGHALSDLFLISAGNGRYALSATNPAEGELEPIRDTRGKPFRFDFGSAVARMGGRAAGGGAR
jgi:hypothetical protein